MPNYYQQTTDFTLGAGWSPFEVDQDIYDGQGHTISYSYLQTTSLSSPPTSYLGLFSVLDSATILNLNVLANVSGVQYIGGLVGIIFADYGPAALSNVHVLAGSTVTAYWNVGGLIGDVSEPGGAVFAQISADAALTQTVGTAQTGFDGCGSVIYGSAGSLIGLVEDNDGSLTINNCAAAGTLSANGIAGGLIGTASDVAINDCISTATLPLAANSSGWNPGSSSFQPCPGSGFVNGLLGVDSPGSFSANANSDSVWSSDTTGCAPGGCSASGFLSDGSGTAGYPLSTLESVTSAASTYPMWDFVHVWFLPNGTSPATLR